MLHWVEAHVDNITLLKNYYPPDNSTQLEPEVTKEYLTFASELVSCPDAIFTFNLRNSNKFVTRTTTVVNLIAIKVVALGTASGCYVG